VLEEHSLLGKRESLKKQKEQIIIKKENSHPSIVLGACVSNTQLGVLNFGQSSINKIKGTDFQ